MSKMMQALESLQDDRVESPARTPKEISHDSAGGNDRVTSAIITVLWLVASITATVFSYSLGVKQGMQKAETASSPDWLYYFSDYRVPQAVSTASSVSIPAVASGEALPLPAPSATASASATSVIEPQPVQIEAIPVASSVLPVKSEQGNPEAANLQLKSGYTIQAATYQNKSRADKEVAALKQKGIHAFVLPSGKFFVLCFESFQDRKLAAKKLLTLISQGYHKTYPGAYVRPFNLR